MSGEDWPPNYTITWHNCSSRAGCALSQIIPRVGDPAVSSNLVQVDTMLDQALTYTFLSSPNSVRKFSIQFWIGQSFAVVGRADETA